MRHCPYSRVAAPVPGRGRGPHQRWFGCGWPWVELAVWLPEPWPPGPVARPLFSSDARWPPATPVRAGPGRPCPPQPELGCMLATPMGGEPPAVLSAAAQGMLAFRSFRPKQALGRAFRHLGAVRWAPPSRLHSKFWAPLPLSGSEELPQCRLPFGPRGPCCPCWVLSSRPLLSMGDGQTAVLWGQGPALMTSLPCIPP